MNRDRLTSANAKADALEGWHPAGQDATVVQPAVRVAPAPPAVDGPTMMLVRVDSPTTLMATVPEPPPVFVDPTGRRRSWLRWIAYGLGLIGLLYTGLVVASFAGAPVNATPLLPLVESTQQPWQPPPAPTLPAAEAPVTTAPATPTTTAPTTNRTSATPARAPSTPATSTAPGRGPSSPPAETRAPRTTTPPTAPGAEPTVSPPPIIDPPVGADAAARVDG
ncbi:hypothetical protein GCM10011608_31640 [Micromonospora sonchi]|uniref:Uncharacterized protein n=1 Tax=Micromonospora sonchi TaxID=1763543 RepID=A0A917TZW0_9ACTN|nr:hypothetical protein [Micromonospora sonchi]GGM44629.1 hypothetical protein GCM10011608_31640 [Micromonospora sonchi]